VKRSAIVNSNEAPIIAQTPDAYRQRDVATPLQRDFACTWFRATGDAPQRTAIIPDGCADLVFVNGALRVAGPDRRVKIEAAVPRLSVVGLRFQPGAATRWLRIPASEFVGARLPLEDFWGAEARRLADWLNEADSPERIGRRLEAALARRLTGVKPPDAASTDIFRIVRLRPDGTAAVTRRLSESLQLSERTIRRRCHEFFGYGPKTLDRILRFQRFLDLVPRHASADMAHLAMDAGYADQPHLIREARELAGLTASAVRDQLIASAR
jgi:AraC-like DNA-binding protein